MGIAELQLVYMGTSAFAVPPLERLLDDGAQIRFVVTQPDKPGGRGQHLQMSPVKRRSLELGLPVQQPSSLKDESANTLFHSVAADLDALVVVAYGKIIPAWLMALPRYGAINVHGSLLPKYRGAAPIHWAIANGEAVTGVCTMRIDEGLDTGPVYLCEETAIGAEESVEQLSARLSIAGSELLSRTLTGVADGSLAPKPQDSRRATVAPILRKQDGRIDWRMPAEAIHNRVRAFNPWPGTVARFRGAICRILKSKTGQQAAPEGAEPGTLVASKQSLAVVCGGSTTLDVLEIQLESRKPVSGAAFLSGARLVPGEKFESVGDN